MSWSPHQQAMLAAMGYQRYRLAGTGPSLPEAGQGERLASADHAAAPVRTAADATAARATTAAPAAAAAAGHEALHRALQRAAGGRALDGLALPPLAELRASAAAKRALWPRLRALRRG